MSVTIEGIKGYEYQYKVTVLISLLKHIDKKKLFVEIEGSEDATLIVEQNTQTIEIEIQVKREKNSIDIPKLLNWLCHFQESKSDNCLLSRLNNDNKRIALFVTRSRCSDTTVMLRRELSKLDIADLKLKKQEFDVVTNKLSNSSFGKTQLMIKRQEYCKNLSKSLQKTHVETILKRVLIWEELSDEILDNEILQILNSDYQIAQSNTEHVYQLLLNIVKAGRDNASDILPETLNILQKNKIGRPLYSNDYQERSEENNLFKIIRTNGILLLTGISQCGKSELAKKIAAFYFDNGFDFKRTNDLDEASRFYSMNISDNKIVILEDPWGHIEPTDKYESIIIKIKELIANKQKHHNLIVTSRIEILYEIFNTENIDDCKLNNNSWFDVTIKDKNKLERYWLTLAKQKGHTNISIGKVSEILTKSRDNDLLQLGQLVFVANEEIKQLEELSIVDIQHLARSNSREIASLIDSYNRKYAEVLSILSMCSDTIYSVPFSDIGYIFSETDTFPSIISKEVFHSSFETKADEFPQYEIDFTISDKILEAIEYFEERGFIMVNDNNIVFTHPNYLEVGRYLFFSKSDSRQKRILNYYRRITSCLNTSSAFLATKNFLFIYNKVKISQKKEIVSIAFNSINSIFPSVEDNSMIFLMNIIEKLSGEERKKLVREIQHGGTSDSNIFWHENRLPFISTNSSFSNIFFSYDKKLINETEVEIKNGKTPNSFKIWNYIEYLKGDKTKNAKELEFLLQYNEAFIRSKSVYILFEKLTETDNKIIECVFQDAHPSVVFNGIRASFMFWFNYPTEIKQFLSNLIKKSLEHRPVAIRAYSLITTFSIDYGHEAILDWEDLDEDQKKELWNLWGELYQVTIKEIPLEVTINSARFGSSMRDAIKYLDIDIGINVLKAWLKRIDFQIKNNKILDEFEMAIADSLMVLTGSKSDYRKDLFDYLVNYNDTSFVLSNLKWIIEHWKNLNITEQEQLIKLTQSDRKDIRWIKALLLNSYSHNTEITYCIFGEKDLFEKDLEYVLSKFTEQLLLDCLNVYCGFPQPLWWLAVHHKNKEFWGQVIIYILENEYQIGFDICLEEFISWGVNGTSSFWDEGIEQWKTICKKTSNKKTLSISLINNTANTTCNLTAANILWKTLINSYIEVNKEDEIIELVCDNIELLQQTGGGRKGDLFKIFEGEFLISKIVHSLIPDSILIKMLTLFETNSLFTEEDKSKMILAILENIKSTPIRFFGTYNFIRSSIDKGVITKELGDKLKSLPNKIKETGENKLNEVKQIFEYKLDDWIGIN